MAITQSMGGNVPSEMVGQGEPCQRQVKLLEWSGSIAGILGAFLLALHSDISGYGFVFFMISNIAFITFAIKMKYWGILMMQVMFGATSVLGMTNYLL
jgi:nicotinamide riboside transporter PnuC